MLPLEHLISPMKKRLEKNHKKLKKWLRGFSLAKAQLFLPYVHTGEGIAGFLITMW